MVEASAEIAKKQFGQFFTKRAEIILKGFEHFVVDKKVIDPFAGEGDLLDWAKFNQARSARGYDIDLTNNSRSDIRKRDSILKPSSGEFVISNPPYLLINKANREIKEKYFSKFDFEDLFHISIKSIENFKEGILIVPLNFLSAPNASKIRNHFFSKFEIDKINYFQYPVFEDTTNNVIALHFKLKEGESEEQIIEVDIFEKSGNTDNFKTKLEKKFDWTIGGEFLYPIMEFPNALKIGRFIEKDFKKKSEKSVKAKLASNNIKTKTIKNIDIELKDILEKNIILLKAIDSHKLKDRIALYDIRKYGIIGLIGKLTSRYQIQLIFEKPISIDNQLKLIELFNNEFNLAREKYKSLFLTNYRAYNRKRAGFDFIYKYLNYLYENRILKS